MLMTGHKCFAQTDDYEYTLMWETSKQKSSASYDSWSDIFVHVHTIFLSHEIHYMHSHISILIYLNNALVVAKVKSLQCYYWF